jgi:diguanylate cyclase (GGDEF)-like protein/PAS domain S-box-containing protein
MDVDIGILEAALSPYIIYMKDSGVEYVSDALARRLGMVTEHLRDTLNKRTDLSSLDSGSRLALHHAASAGGSPVFSCVHIPYRDLRILALSEEDANGIPTLMEKGDHEIFIRMLKASGAACVIVEKGSIVYANDRFCSLLDLDNGTVHGRKLIEYVSQVSRGDFIRSCEGWSETGGNEDVREQEILFTSSTGTRKHLMVSGGLLKRDERRLLWTIMRDVSEVRKLEKMLKEEQKRFSELFERFPLGILYISPRGTILECNDFVADLMGYVRAEIQNRHFTDFVSSGQIDALKKEFQTLFTRGAEIKRHECVLNTRHDNTVTIEYNAQLICRKGYPSKALMIFTDVTDKKILEMELLEKNAEMERTLWDMAEVKDALEARAGELNKATEDLKLLNEKLNLLSITDGLTEVYNHRHFQDRLSEEVERLQRQKGSILSLLILDIDDFKYFNDTYGHQCGDMVLKQLAMILKNSIRTIDILARYGGEEFAIILPNSNAEQAVVVAERICEAIRSTPFSFAEGTVVKVTVSIGVGTITSTDGDKSILVKRADSALYAAKAKWKDRVEVWEEE